MLSAEEKLLCIRGLLGLYANVCHPERQHKTTKPAGNFFNHENGSGEEIRA
jgi:hypothetical protein